MNLGEWVSEMKTSDSRRETRSIAPLWTCFATQKQVFFNRWAAAHDSIRDFLSARRYLPPRRQATNVACYAVRSITMSSHFPAGEPSPRHKNP